MKVCPTYGPGFFYIPGSDTCLRVFGNARFEANVSQRYARNDDTTSYRSGLQIGLDARNNTELGLVRTVARIDAMYRTGDSGGMGALRSGSATRLGVSTYQNNGYGSIGAPNGVGAQDYIEVMGYVQMGGFTFGRLQSAFTFAGPSGGQAVGYHGVIGGDSPFMQNQFGYTLSMGNGVTATLSVEDPTQRRMGIVVSNPAAAIVPAAANAMGYSGNRVPDVVGNLTVTQGWGQVKVSGAYHEVRDNQGDIGTKSGYAGQIGIKLAADMIAKGDAFYIQGGYAVGANSYLWNGLTSNQPGSSSAATGNNGLGLGSVGATLADAAILTNSAGTGNRKMYLAKSMGGAVAFDHYWVPTVHSWVAASYTAIDWSSAVRNTAVVTGAGISSSSATIANVDPGKHYMVSFGTEWNPIKGLAVGSEVSWGRVSLADAAPAGNTNDPNAGAKKSQDIWGARFRVKRDF